MQGFSPLDGKKTVENVKAANVRAAVGSTVSIRLDSIKRESSRLERYPKSVPSPFTWNWNRDKSIREYSFTGSINR